MSGSRDPSLPRPGRSRTVHPRAGGIRFSVANMDRSAPPAKDFYRYASGHWVDTHPTPADKARWTGFDELRERNFLLVRSILEETARRRGGGPDGKVGAFFRSALDARARTRAGTRILAEDRARVEALSSPDGIPELLAQFHRTGSAALFDTDVVPDERESARYALYFWQGGLSLPDRDYYLAPRFAAVRRAYRRHIERLLRLAGEEGPRARRAAADVVAIETALARASRDRVALREPTRNYHRFTPAQLARRFPGSARASTSASAGCRARGSSSSANRSSWRR